MEEIRKVEEEYRLKQKYKELGLDEINIDELFKGIDYGSLPSKQEYVYYTPSDAKIYYEFYKNEEKEKKDMLKVENYIKDKYINTEIKQLVINEKEGIVTSIGENHRLSINENDKKIVKMAKTAKGDEFDKYTGAALALVYQFSQNTSETSGSYHYGKMEHGIIDFGQYINPPSGYQPIVNNNVRKSDSMYTDKSGTSETEFYDNGVCTWTVFGENIVYGNQQVPITALMPMHFKGRTRTITALNHIKNLTNKTFTVTYANSAPAYWPQDGDQGTGGYPPGNKN